MNSPISEFLPPEYDANAPVAVLAGRGFYPKLMVDRIRKAGVPVRLISFVGETSDELIDQFDSAHHQKIKVGQVGKLLKTLQNMGCRYNVMVGQIKPSRLFGGIHPDLKAFRILQQLKVRNAETIYGAVVKEMEQIGVQTLDARAFIDDQLASPGLMTSGKWKLDDSTLEHGIRIANEIARLDIGQGIVVKNGTVLCVEEFNGTDEMLKRAANYKTSEKLFVKTVKPNQNYAIDVPVFGEKTIRSMVEGGVRHAALAVGKTIILDKKNVLELARKEKINLFGFEHKG
ncbi:MAG: UDP-2,3-diacylglucosamine diphosphatase LpxI [Opitutales bacterium]|nr:UDP-2,3-diacylglucosamine diphosphatase LpxI [Opitutales bacterium]